MWCRFILATVRSLMLICSEHTEIMANFMPVCFQHEHTHTQLGISLGVKVLKSYGLSSQNYRVKPCRVSKCILRVIWRQYGL